jgi:hypothetical membrane protein
MSWPASEGRHYQQVPPRCWYGVAASGGERRSGQQATGNDMSTGRPRIRVGAVMWIAGPVQYLIALLVAQAAWRTRYSWMVNPLSDLGAVHCQRTGSGYPLPRYVCSPLHGVVNASVIVLGVLLVGGVLLTASCWVGGTASRAARILLLASAASSVMIGLVPEDVNLSLHLLGAFVGIVVGNCALVLAGLIRRSSPLGRLRPVTLPLSILALAAAVLLFTGGVPASGFGGVQRLAVFPLRCWMVIAGIFLLREAARSDGVGPASRAATLCLGGRGRLRSDLSVRRSAGMRRYPRVTASTLPRRPDHRRAVTRVKDACGAGQTGRADARSLTRASRTHGQAAARERTHGVSPSFPANGSAAAKLQAETPLTPTRS